MADLTLETLLIGIVQLITPGLTLIGIAGLMLITALITRSLTQRHIIRHHLGDIIKPQIDLRDARIHYLEKEVERLQLQNSRFISAIRTAAAALYFPEKAVKTKLKAVGK